MGLYAVAFIGGLLTIVSPCILPVLPFVFARADQPFRRSGLPLLVGMALTFVAVGSLATVAGDWIVRANEVGRYVAMALFSVFGLALLFPAVADALSRPAVVLGARLQSRSNGQPSTAASIVLGISTGLLWTPCAGPILGLILTGAAVEGSSAKSAALLLAFAAGAAAALAVALMAGNRMFQLMKRSLRVEAWIRRGLGVAVLAGVFGIAMGWDTGVLARISLTPGAGTNGFEQQLVDRVRPAPSMVMMSAAQAREEPLPLEGTMPPLDGAIQWLNSPPLTRDGLRGKVVMIDFWTYSCINCLRAIPYVEAWSEKYKNSGLVVIGVHTPEFAFERDKDNVSKAVQGLKLTYPIAVDSNRTIWNAFRNSYWPAHYFIDRQGRIRHHHFGEGDYQGSERVIQQLLRENSAGEPASNGFVQVTATGAQAAPNLNAVGSPETYLGYLRQEHFASPEDIKRGDDQRYTAPGRLRVNQWALDGWWNVGEEEAHATQSHGKIVFRFHARDLHLVLGPKSGNKPLRFRVLLDGAPPADDAGADVDKQGNGSVTGYRLYQLIRQKGPVEDRTFQIEFVDPGVQAFAFTFG
jgi:cytochrome c biogenesis protein CcdA/thiol-disulfide isomerase/thioredoxin